MVKECRGVIKEGELGKKRKVIVEYPQGWLSRKVYKGVNVQAAWRTDPARSGKSGCMADIGTHAAHLAEYVSGMRIIELCAQLTSFSDGNARDDDGTVLLKLEYAAVGELMAVHMDSGEENALKNQV